MDTYPLRYVDASALGAYSAQYAAAFGVDEVARFGCRVTDVAPLEGGRWRVGFATAAGGPPRRLLPGASGRDESRLPTRRRGGYTLI